MPSATIKKERKEAFLKPLHTFDDLLRGRQFVMWNGQILYKNGKGYVLTNISKDEEYTREDYMKLPEGSPFQLIEGKLIHMPSPKETHQRISIFLSSTLFMFARQNNLGQVWSAPFDVHFDKKNIFQPDILFVAKDRMNIVKDWVFGAPDLVVEIISPGSKKMDSKDKLEVYGKYHVKEYWLIDPQKKTLEWFENHEDKMVYRKKLKTGDILISKVLTGFELEISEIFG